MSLSLGSDKTIIKTFLITLNCKKNYIIAAHELTPLNIHLLQFSGDLSNILSL